MKKDNRKRKEMQKEKSRVQLERS